MKKISILLLLAFSLISCDNIITESKLEKDYKIILIDNCEYITYNYTAGYSGYGFMAHKGNCKNPIHCHNQL